MTTGPEKYVVASRPWMLNSSVHAASTAASTTGRYSGWQPAITALIATFSTVHSTRSGGTTATTSSGSRVVPVSMRATRSWVGGTTGRPSVQPAVEHRLGLVLVLAELDPARAETGGAGGVGAGGGDVGVEGARAAAGPVLGQSGAERRPPVSASHSGRSQPSVRATTSPPRHAEQRRHGVDLERERDLELGVVDDLHAVRERRVVLRVDGERERAVGEVGEHRRDELAGRAVALDDRDQPVGEWRCGHARSMR